MTWRIASFVLCMIAVGGAAGWLAGEWGALAGMVAGAIAWFLVDLMRSLRVLHWLRSAPGSTAPRMSGLWGEIVDRTRRQLRSREQQAADSAQRLQDFLAAIQASPNGVVLLDPDGRIEWSNQTAAQHLSIDPQRDHLQLVGNLLRDPLFAAYYAAGDSAQDVVILSRDSTPARPVKISVQLHPYGDGRKLLLTRDITSVEQAETMRRDFVANVSHEIRTPLTVLAGFVETLQSIALPQEDRARYLALMGQQAQRMQILVNDLLTLSRLEGSPLPGASEWTPAAQLGAQCEQEVRALADMLGKDLDLAFQAPPAIAISGAASELLSALVNLASNAVRYTPDGGSIRVDWRLLDDGRAVFEVSDTGPGIAAEHLSRLTERFYRIDRSRSRETGGTGLGLAIVKHVVQRHGAELRIESTVGSGSKFSIHFPASRIRAAVPPQEPQRASARVA